MHAVQCRFFNGLLDRKARKTQYEQTLVEAQREAKKPFHEQQLALYLEATNVTSRISVPLSEDDKAAAIVRFWQLYWGQLALVPFSAPLVRGYLLW